MKKRHDLSMHILDCYLIQNNGINYFLQMSDNASHQGERQRIVIVPGMGCVPVRDCNWYAWLYDELEKHTSGRFEVILEDMPDPHAARESQWLPFIRDTLKIDDQNNFNWT